jgi:outer membrane protein OmpA-like peptidoglycan-associated protein
MSKRLLFPVLALVTMSLGASFGGCQCSSEAKMGNQMEAKNPEPPPPPPPSAPAPAPTQDAPPVVRTVKNVTLEGNKVQIPGELEFDIDKSTIKKSPQSIDILNTLVAFLKENPNVTKLRIEGHTDNTGTADHNKKLSNDRAASVAKWLAENGVDSGRLHTIGFGRDKPLVPNDSPQHKAQNRRTEFHVEEIDGKPAPQDQGASGSATAGGGGTPPATGTDDKTSTAAPAATDKKTDKKPKDKKTDKTDKSATPATPATPTPGTPGATPATPATPSPASSK